MRIKQLVKVLGLKFYLVDTSTSLSINHEQTPEAYSSGCIEMVDFEVKGITCDSRQVRDDFIFVAIKGNSADGSTFIDEAISKGARTIIVQSPLGAGKPEVRSKNNVSIIEVEDARKALGRLAATFYQNPSSHLRVVGITGTNGKTTVSYLIEAILKEDGSCPAVIGTVNYRFRDKITPAWNTTPGPVELNSMLAEMLKEGVDYCVMEASSHALDQDRTEGIKFHSALFTNLTQDHLDYHKTMEDYFRSKTKLFENVGGSGFAVINNDDIFGPRLKELTKSKVITYGIDHKSDIMAKDIKFDVSHTEFVLCAGNLKPIFKTKLIGKHNVYNTLAAVAWSLSEGLDLQPVKSAIEGFASVPGRLERIDAAVNFKVFVDYAHTEDALFNILTALRQLPKNRIIVVFGCGGDRDKTKRPKMGRVASEMSDYAIITNDNPRSEDPLQIIEDIKRGIKGYNYCVIPDRRKAIERSLSMAGDGDVVLIAGKGHEHYQILGDHKVHFDDKEVAGECLKRALTKSKKIQSSLIRGL